MYGYILAVNSNITANQKKIQKF